MKIFFFCGRSAVLRPSVHMLPGIGWCGAGLPPFPTACWWLTHPAAITGVSVPARWDSPGGCGGSSVPLLCNRRVQSPWCQFASGVLAGHSVLFATWIYWSVDVLPDDWLGQYRVYSLQWLFSIDISTTKIKAANVWFLCMMCSFFVRRTVFTSAWADLSPRYTLHASSMQSNRDPKHTHDHLVGLVVKASASRAENLGFSSCLCHEDFSRSSHTSDKKTNKKNQHSSG